MEEVPVIRRLELIALRPDSTRAAIEHLCAEARRHECMAVCVPGTRVELAATLLDETGVKVAALVGFPFGTCETDVKRMEIEAALESGAQELDFAVNLGWLKDGNDRAVVREMRDLREAAEERPLKAVIELALLNEDEIRRATLLALEAELQFLVSATGCAARPTSIEDVRTLREIAGPDLGIKAVGGVDNGEQARALIRAGANRLGVLSLSPFAAGGE
jgi:deoxyribose-phosphate aldolase